MSLLLLLLHLLATPQCREEVLSLAPITIQSATCERHVIDVEDASRLHEGSISITTWPAWWNWNAGYFAQDGYTFRYTLVRRL